MGMLSAMYAGVNGLNVHGRALSSVADNVANVSTYAFKATRINFGDIMVHSLSVGGTVAEQVGTGARVLSVQNMLTQGSMENTDVPLDMAINGSGFFSVKKASSTTGTTGNTNSAGTIYYTRAGQFSLDKQGYVVSPTGMRLQGFNIDANGDLEQVIGDLRITTVQADAIPTTGIDLSINLDAEDTATHSASSAVAPTDKTSFNYVTTIRTYDSLGVSHDLSLYFQRLDALPSSTPTGASTAWKCSVFENQSGSMVPQPGNPPNNTFYLCFDTNGHIVGTTDYYGLSALGDMFTSAGSVSQPSNSISTRIGEALTFTGQGASQTYRSTLDITVNSNGSAGDYLTINGHNYTLGANQASTAATASAYADLINAYGANAGYDYYAVANGNAITLYPTSNTTTALGVTSSATNVTITGNTLNSVVNTLNNGQNATGSLYVNLAGLVSGASTVTVNGVTYNYVNPPVGASDFNTVAGLATLIDGQANLTATSNGSSIFVSYSNAVGTAGNAIAMSTNDATDVVLSGSSGTAGASSTLQNGIDGTTAGANATDVVASAYHNSNGTYSLRLARNTGGASSTLSISTSTATLGASSGFTTTSWTQNQYAADAEPAPTSETAGERTLSFSFPGATPNQSITFDFTPTTSSASTQSAGASETFYLYQDGAPRGNLQSLDVGSDGLITGQFTNGTVQTLGAVVLTNFANPEALKRDGDNLWVSTLASGSATTNRPGDAGLGTLESGALEQSNVDLAGEFVKMINYQRAFQANSKTISTTDQMLQELIQLKR